MWPQSEPLSCHTTYSNVSSFLTPSLLERESEFVFVVSPPLDQLREAALAICSRSKDSKRTLERFADPAPSNFVDIPRLNVFTFWKSASADPGMTFATQFRWKIGNSN